MNYPTDYAFCVTFAAPNGDKWYIDFRTDPNLKLWLKDELLACASQNVIAIAHNASFDARMLDSAGVPVPLEIMDCTVIRAVQIDEHRGTLFPWMKWQPPGYSLDSLATHYKLENKLVDVYSQLAELYGGPATRKAQIGNLQYAPPEVVEPYAIHDALLALRIWEAQQQDIDSQQIQDICDFERQLMPTLIRTEMRGIDVDIDYTEEAMEGMEPIIEEAKASLFKEAGWDINVNSPKQMRELFQPKQDKNGDWTSRDGTALETTKTGNPSIDSEALRAMSDPAAKYITELRSLIKTKDTFLGKHILKHAINEKVYPNINQSKQDKEGGGIEGTGTGRLSYTNPAMQQIPSRNKRVAAIVKPAFVPPHGHTWVDSDLASFEVRVFAHLVGAYNPALVKAYKNNPKMDGHQYVADLTGLVRSATYSGQANAKQLNLSMIFNSGNGAIADKMGLPYEWKSFDTVEYGMPKVVNYRKAGQEAMQLINMYHQKFQGVKTLANKAKDMAEYRGYVRTAYGRRLRFPRGYKSYKASGLLIQATSADVNKENWMLIEEALGDDGHIIINTHDSYSMAIQEDWKRVYKRVQEAIESGKRRADLRVPILLDFNGAGKNWWEALQG